MPQYILLCVAASVDEVDVHVSTIIGGYVVGVGVVASVEEVNLRVSTIIGGYCVGDNVNLKIYSKKSKKYCYICNYFVFGYVLCIFVSYLLVCKFLKFWPQQYSVVYIFDCQPLCKSCYLLSCLFVCQAHHMQLYILPYF